MDAELVLVVEWRVGRVLAAPVAEYMPGDLRRTPDEELETPDVRVVVVPRRRREEDGVPPLREAPKPSGFSSRRLRPAVVVEDEPVRAATPTQGLMSGNLLSAIQQGTTLKKAVVEEDTVREKPNDLLSAIKRGANLRKVSDAPPAEPPQTKGRGGLLGNEVDKILNLRAKIAAASESSSSDSGSDWD